MDTRPVAIVGQFLVLLLGVGICALGAFWHGSLYGNRRITMSAKPWQDGVSKRGLLTMALGGWIALFGGASLSSSHGGGYYVLTFVLIIAAAAAPIALHNRQVSVQD